MNICKKLDVHGEEHLNPTLWKLFGFIANHYEKKGKIIIITSIAEGIHTNGSFHYIYRAIDFGRNGFIKKDIRILINDWCARYGHKTQDFDLLEYDKDRGDFFHLEFDPK